MKFLKYYLIFTVAFLMMFSTFSYAQISIIAYNDVSVQSIDKNILMNLYTLHSNELGSKKVKLFFLNENSKTDEKFLSILGMSFLELKKTWLKGKLTGNGNPPEIITTSTAMIEKIMSTPGAVGFVDSKSVKGNLKVLLKID